MYIWVQVFWNNLNHIDHITATVVWWLVCSLDRRSWVRAQVGSNQYYEIGTGICCFSAKHATLGSKSKDWLERNRNNVSEWSDMCFADEINYEKNDPYIWRKEWWFDWFLVFSATFSYIMATSFSGGGSRREPPTLGKQKECKGGQFKKTFERQVVVFHYLWNQSLK